jgi:hypothetical protein
MWNPGIRVKSGWSLLPLTSFEVAAAPTVTEVASSKIAVKAASVSDVLPLLMARAPFRRGRSEARPLPLRVEAAGQATSPGCVHARFGHGGAASNSRLTGFVLTRPNRSKRRERRNRPDAGTA